MSNTKKIIDKWKNDYDYKTVVNSVGSTFVSMFFALYNGFLGLFHSSVWNMSIGLYYILLTTVRAVIIITEKNNLRRDPLSVSERRKKTFFISSVILIVMDFSLIVPIYLMIILAKPVNFDKVAAIAMTAHTVYRIILASVNFKKKNRSENLLVKELRTINFIDALLSIVTLQNTLVMINHHDGENMPFASALTSAVILLFIVLVSLFSLSNGIKAEKDDRPES